MRAPFRRCRGVTRKRLLITLALVAAVAVPLAPSAGAVQDLPKVGACNLNMRPPDEVSDALTLIYDSPAGPAARTAVTTVCSL